MKSLFTRWMADLALRRQMMWTQRSDECLTLDVELVAGPWTLVTYILNQRCVTSLLVPQRISVEVQELDTNFMSRYTALTSRLYGLTCTKSPYALTSVASANMVF